MKQMILALTLITSAATSFAASPEEHRQNIRRLTDRIYDEVAVSKVEAEKLQKAESHMRAALMILQGQDVPPADAYDRNQCLKFILDRNFGPGTAAQTCDALKTGAEFSCVQLVMGKNYGPQTAVDSCKGVKQNQLTCFADIMERNYGPQRAREICYRE